MMESLIAFRPEADVSDMSFPVASAYFISAALLKFLILPNSFSMYCCAVVSPAACPAAYVLSA